MYIYVYIYIYMYIYIYIYIYILPVGIDTCQRYQTFIRDHSYPIENTTASLDEQDTDCACSQPLLTTSHGPPSTQH